MIRILSRIYSLRCQYGPTVDIIIHANDVKSALRQVKLHPDIMGAFSYIIADKLLLSCGQPFGTDFSPLNWEVVHQVLEHLATQHFQDTSLRTKHRPFLNNLTWDRSLSLCWECRDTTCLLRLPISCRVATYHDIS